MKRIQFICDKCLKIIDTKITIALEQPQAFLFPVGNQEWCYNCLTKLDSEATNLPSKLAIMTPEELERYAKI